MPLTSAEIVDVTAFCGYPAASAVAYADLTTKGYVAQLVATLPNLTDDELVWVRNALTQLRLLRDAIPAAGGQTLLVEQAAVFKRNPTEIAERSALYDQWRRRLAFFLGVPLGVGALAPIPAAFVV